MQNVFDRQGHPILLGEEIGRGGEGAVFEVAQRPDILAKIYHKPLDAEKAAKIAAMVALRSDRLLKIAAWPVDTVHPKAGATPVGLLMPRLIGLQEVHTLYGPKSRLAHFPNATWPFLVHTAMNAARAFAVVHECGHVIGDVNQSSLYVSERGTVRLIDCDSFQITQNGHSYLCEVGVPTHTPPELQGKAFRGVTRTPNHDNFGLAVVVFQLLFMGRHPFSGQYLGPGDMSIEKAISGFRFAYGPGAGTREMRPPPATLPLESVSEPLAQLFERAFSPDGAKPSGRPRAEDWVTALATLGKSVKPCRKNVGHQYFSALADCPWCEIEGKSGIVLFNVVLIGKAGSGSTFNLHVVWAQITAVPHPGPLPSLAVPQVKASPSARIQQAKQQRLFRRWISYGLASLVTIVAISMGGGWFGFFAFVFTLVLAGGIANSPFKQMKVQAQLALKMAEVQRQSAEERWKREAGGHEFDQRTQELTMARETLQSLEAQRQRRLQQLEQERPKRQLEKYLDRYKIHSANIDGIGQGRVATLQSYGVETAADVVEQDILRIPGFGPSLTGRLLAWRHMHEQKFAFNPAVGIDPADLQSVQQEYSTQKIRLERDLMSGPQSLQQISQQILYKREALRPTVEQAFRSFAAARADFDGIK